MEGTESYSLCASIGLAIECILTPTKEVFVHALQRSTRLRVGARDEDGLTTLAELLRSYAVLSSVWGYDAGGNAHTRYEQRMGASHGLYTCCYPITDVVFRNVAKAATGVLLGATDGVIGYNGNKWVTHSNSTSPGEFCDFNGTHWQAVVALLDDYCKEPV